MLQDLIEVVEGLENDNLVFLTDKIVYIKANKVENTIKFSEVK